MSKGFYGNIKKIEVKRKYVYISWCYGKTLRYLKNDTEIECSITIRPSDSYINKMDRIQGIRK